MSVVDDVIRSEARALAGWTDPQEREEKIYERLATVYRFVGFLHIQNTRLQESSPERAEEE